MAATRPRDRAKARRRERAPSAGTVSFRQDHAAALRQLLLRLPGVREGRMFGYPAFFVGRRLFACVHGDGVGLKLPAHRARALLAAGTATAFQPHGKPPMREWIEITRACSADYASDRDLIAEAMAFVTQAPSDRSAP